MERKTYSLYELSQYINKIIKVNIDEAIWIRTEISECREHANGHCYLEFIEKNPTTDSLIAKVKANIWAQTYRMLKPMFEQQTGETLRAGLNVLVAVVVEYHDVYGLSLNVRDIDPSYTLGELAKRRQEIIRKLEADGVMEMNKELEMPLLPQRLAIISSATAAGYDDFCNQLDTNSEGFIFYKKLFPALMQGDKADISIIEALDRVYEHIDAFDAVVMIRGGGATTDMACFDSYELALHCAQFPLPIITGIGHQRDLSIIDMVAHTSVKTPTAAAAFLIEQMDYAKGKMTGAYRQIYDLLKNRVGEQEQKLSSIHREIRFVLQQKSSTKKNQLERQQVRLKHAIQMALSAQNNKLALLEANIERHSPAFLLKHGYTLTTINGKRINSISEVKKGDSIKTYLTDGELFSKVENLKSRR